MGCLVQFGVTDNELGWKVSQGNVLYLDWEEPDKDAETQRKRLNAIICGLGVKDERPLLYLPCSRSFIDMLPQMKRLVHDRNIILVIIDSQMAATAGNASYQPDIVASLFYNGIKALHCTAIIVDHITKEDMKNGNNEVPVAAYGSIVKYNRAAASMRWRPPMMLNPTRENHEKSLAQSKRDYRASNPGETEDARD